jgi:hypothetical protein
VSLQYRGIKWEKVQEPELRACFQALDQGLTSIFQQFSAVIETDPGLGAIRLKAPIVLLDGGVDPQVTSTRGRRGELRRLGQRLFIKSLTSATDVNWDEIPSGSTFVPSTRVLTAGLGLTGGGNLSANRTFDVGAGFGTVVAADTVAVDQAMVPTWTGVHTFTPQPIFNAGISLGTSGVINSAEPDGGGQPAFLLQPTVSRVTDPLLQLKDFPGTVVASVTPSGYGTFQGVSLGTSGVVNSAEPDGGGQPAFLFQPTVNRITDNLLEFRLFATSSGTGTGTLSSSGTAVTGAGGTQFTTRHYPGSTITASGRTRTISTITSDTALTTSVAFGNAGTGTGTISTVGVAVTGAGGTLFTTELVVGATITASGGTRTVATITSNTALTTSVAFGSSGTGTCTTITSVGAAVTGVGTLFTTELVIGGTITVSGQTRTVLTITDATTLTVSVAFSPDVSAATFTFINVDLSAVAFTFLNPNLSGAAFTFVNDNSTRATSPGVFALGPGGELGVQGFVPVAGQLLAFNTATSTVATLTHGIAARVNMNTAVTPAIFEGVRGTAALSGAGATVPAIIAGIVGTAGASADYSTLTTQEIAGVVAAPNVINSTGALSSVSFVSNNLKSNWARASGLRVLFYAPSTSGGAGTNRTPIATGITTDIPAYSANTADHIGLDILSSTSTNMRGNIAGDTITAYGARIQFPQGRTTNRGPKAHIRLIPSAQSAGGYVGSITPNAAGDLYFDLGTNNPIGLAQHNGTNWQWFLTPTMNANGAIAAGNAGTVSGTWQFNTLRLTPTAAIAGGPAGATAGDLYTDNGTNNPRILASYDTAWRFLLHPASEAWDVAGAGNWGPITGRWEFTNMDDVQSVVDSAAWLFTSRRSDAVGVPDAFRFKATYADIADITDHTAWLNNASTKIMRLGKTGALTLTNILTGTSVTLSGSLVATGGATLNGLTMTDTTNISFGTSGGTIIGTTTSQKMGLWLTTPIIQPAAALQAAITNSTGGSQDGTLAACASVGVDVVLAASQADVNARMVTINNNFTDVFALLDAMRTAMVAFGSMKGAA